MTHRTGKRKFRTLVIKMMIILVTATVTVGACELMLQLFWDDGEVLLYELDPVVLHRIRPNIRKRHVLSEADGDRTIISQYNRFGFRGEDFDPVKGERYRVIVYGDSNVTAKFTRLEATFPKQLERALIEAGHNDVEVLNAGVPGYGPDQVSLRLAEELGRFAPDLVILNVCANDYGDLIRNKIYRLDETGLVLNDYRISHRQRFNLFLGNFKILRYIKLVYLRAKGLPSSSPRIESLTRQQARKLYENSSIKSAYDDYLANNEVKNLFNDSSDLLNVFPNEQSSLLASELMEHVLVRVHELVRGHGAALIVTIQPAQRDILTDPKLQRFPDYDRYVRTSLLESICAKHGIPAVNLFDVFENHDDPADLYFVVDYRHWNDRGQKVAADAVSDFILEKGFVK